MYGRTPRDLTLPVTGTSDAVGPGTYWPRAETSNRRRIGIKMFT